jgi:hypothetical protein
MVLKSVRNKYLWLSHAHLCARDFQQFLGDIGLSELVVFEGQIFDELVGIVGGIFHRHHSRAMLAGFGFQQDLKDLKNSDSEAAMRQGPVGRGFK